MNRQQSNGDPPPTGRNPTAPLAVPNAHTEPLKPPGRLSTEEREIWLEATQSVRADWFRGGSELVLETFCRAVAIERRLACLLRESDPQEDLDFGALVKMHHGAAMLVGNLAGKLRLTVRSLRVRDTRRLPRAWEGEPKQMPS